MVRSTLSNLLGGGGKARGICGGPTEVGSFLERIVFMRRDEECRTALGRDLNLIVVEIDLLDQAVEGPCVLLSLRSPVSPSLHVMA